MERWVGRVAVVTGASSGIGAAIAVDLAAAGMIVVGLARRKERVEKLSSSLASPKGVGKIVAYKCDVSSESEIKNAFAWIESNYGGVDVLVNNAGITASGQLNLTDENNTDAVKSIIDVNLIGLVLCVREAFQSMKKQNVDGHVVLINSIAGHSIPNLGVSMNIYPATKFGVTALTEIYRQEFNLLNTKTKITSISPGAVDTEIIPSEIKAKFLEAQWPFLESKDISAAVLYVLGTPPHVQVHELMIKPVGEKF